MLENLKGMKLEEDDLDIVNGGVEGIKTIQVGKAPARQITPAVQRGKAENNQQLLGELKPDMMDGKKTMSGGTLPGSGVC